MTRKRWKGWSRYGDELCRLHDTVEELRDRVELFATPSIDAHGHGMILTGVMLSLNMLILEVRNVRPGIVIKRKRAYEAHPGDHPKRSGG